MQPQFIAIFFFECIFLIVLVGSHGFDENDHHTIESPKLSGWGEWGHMTHCPSDQVVVGMHLKVHKNQGIKDDTGLNAVKFFCQNPYSSSEYSDDKVSITSLVGPNGEWQHEMYCPTNARTKYVAVGFQLRSETSAGMKDDTAGNNLKLVCSDLFQKQGFVVLEGDGNDRGEWTKQQICWPGYAICGLQTQVETVRSMDTTGLNNMKVRCCKASAANSPKHEADSGESNSSEDSQSSSSASGEQQQKGADEVRGHHSNSDESGQSQENSSEYQTPYEEQELVAIDPEPIDASMFHNDTETKIPFPSHHYNFTINSSEDGILSNEISPVDQMDKIDVQAEGELEIVPTTTIHSQLLPQDNARVLDSNFPKNDENIGQERIIDTSINAWNEYDDKIDPNHINKHETERHVGPPNPKSSPHFGQMDVSNTTMSNSSPTGKYLSCSIFRIASLVIVTRIASLL